MNLASYCTYPNAIGCVQESLALASMVRDHPPASSTASSTAPASSTTAAMRGKVGSEFET